MILELKVIRSMLTEFDNQNRYSFLEAENLLK